MPSIAGENRSVSPSVIEETVKLVARGGVGGVGAGELFEPHPADRTAPASARPSNHEIPEGWEDAGTGGPVLLGVGVPP